MTLSQGDSISQGPCPPCSWWFTLSLSPLFKSSNLTIPNLHLLSWWMGSHTPLQAVPGLPFCLTTLCRQRWWLLAPMWCRSVPWAPVLQVHTDTWVYWVILPKAAYQYILTNHSSPSTLKGSPFTVFCFLWNDQSLLSSLLVELKELPFYWFQNTIGWLNCFENKIVWVSYSLLSLLSVTLSF